MNAFDFLNDNTKLSLGWTLLHSLWQGAILLGLTKIITSLIPTQKSNQRYLVNCVAMFTLLASCAITFFYLNSSGTIPQPGNTNVAHLVSYSFTPENTTSGISLWGNLTQTINHQITLLVTIWLIGVLLFATRFIGGVIYIQHLKKQVREVSTDWVLKTRTLSKQIGFTRMVTLVESVHITKPIVVGYLKPMILLPIGLLAGLPTAQVEAILLHELSHIKRHDFLINLIQSIIEVTLFFNPFVWVISDMVRKEREHCCDDQVIRYGSNPLDYIRALAQLQEIQLENTPRLALALNKNKHQVFNRIKRIMETSVTKNQGKVKPFILLVLLAAGLLCASWINIDSNRTYDNELSALDKNTSIAIVNDTIIEKNKAKDKNKTKSKEQDKDKDKSSTSGSYSRQSITTYDEDGTPHQEVIENFEGDEEMRPLLTNPGFFSFSAPSMPSMPSLPSMPSAPSIPTIPAIPALPAMPGFPFGTYYEFEGDTIPGHYFSEEEKEKWEEFGREMEERFKHFGEDHEEFAHSMEEWADKLGDNFSIQFDKDFAPKMEAFAEQFKDMNFDHNFDFKFDMDELNMNLDKMHDQLKEHEAEWKKVEHRMEEFEVAMAEQLVKDGYLKKGDKVKSMNWGDGKLTVNGIEIKEKDVPKYEALSKQFFKGKHGFYISN